MKLIYTQFNLHTICLLFSEAPERKLPFVFLPFFLLTETNSNSYHQVYNFTLASKTDFYLFDSYIPNKIIT